MKQNESKSNLPLHGQLQDKSKGNFFNTVGLMGEELAKAKLQIGSQERKILELLSENPNESSRT